MLYSVTVHEVRERTVDIEWDNEDYMELIAMVPIEWEPIDVTYQSWEIIDATTGEPVCEVSL